MSYRIEIEQRESAFQNELSAFSIKHLKHKVVNEFFEDVYLYFEPMIESLLDMHYMIKVSTCFHAIFEKKCIQVKEMKRQ